MAKSFSALALEESQKEHSGERDSDQKSPEFKSPFTRKRSAEKACQAVTLESKHFDTSG